MIITTAGRTSKEMIAKACQVAKELNVPFVPRKKEAVEEIQQREQADVLVVGKQRLELHVQDGDEPIFFHPNSAMFRAKRFLRGEREPFLEAVKLQEGMTFLDCTLGLGADSIMASLAVGETGRVIGLEGSRVLAYIVKEGLTTWNSDILQLNKAMKRIQVVNENFEAYLHCCEDNSMDVVYFDPMFSETIEESDGIKGLRQVAVYSTLTEETLQEAKRVAKHRIVLKDHWQSCRFEQFSFHVLRRKTAKFHFGVIEL